MKVDEMFPKRYASGADLNGKAVVVVIAGVQREKMRGADGWVLYVQGGRKGIVMCPTLGWQIAEAVGETEADKWTGKRVTLYPEPMNVAGTPRIAVRARKANGQNGHAAEEGAK